MSIVDMLNWAITKIRLTKKPFEPSDKFPFSTLMGLNRDKNKDG